MQILLQTAAPNAADWVAALTARLPEAAIAVWPEAPQRIDYLLVWKPPSRLFVGLPTPKAIFNLGAGVDLLLRTPGLPADVPLFRLEDAGMAAQMIDYVLAAVLTAYREFPAYREQQAAGVWRARAPIPKDAFLIGILGCGLLGQAVGCALARLGFPVRGWVRTARSPGPESPFPLHAGPAALPAFLAQSRVLVCLLPSTPATIGFIDAARLAQLPAGTHLVNVARGDIVVEADLLAVLDAGRLASATLDVFCEEPLPPGNPLWRHPRVTLTPHVSAVTGVAESALQVATKIRRFEQGLAVSGAVDRDRGY